MFGARGRCLAIAILGIFSANSVAASIYEYTYTGRELVTTDPFSQVGWPEFWPAYEGIMRIDEDALASGSLQNAAITFNAMDGETYPFPDAPGLVAFTVFPFPAVAGSHFSFSTDSLGRIMSWNGYFLDGPPDGGISNGLGDGFDIPTTPWLSYTAPPGAWSDPRLVPVPFSVLLLLSGIVAIYLVSHRRERSYNSTG